MIFITATGGVLSIILIIALAFLLRQRDIEAGDVEGEGAGQCAAVEEVSSAVGKREAA